MSSDTEIESQPHGPCSGIRVLDVTSLISGPFCSQILADLGAEVIKVEPPGGDLTRRQPPLHAGLGALFEQLNRGKKSFEVDLKSTEGQGLVRKLADTVDVFLENNRPGVMQKLGLGYEDLRRSNEQLIYVSINGFGDTGPFAHRPAYDGVIQGLTGFMPIQGAAGEPTAIRCSVADKVTSIWAANAVLAALLHRERTHNRGQKVVVNMTAAYAAFILLDQMSEHTFRSVGVPPSVQSMGYQRTLETADGSVIGLVANPDHYRRFCTALGRDDLSGDPRFRDPLSIVSNIEVLYGAVADRVRQMNTATFLTLMNDQGIPFSKVNTVAEFLASPEALHTGTFQDLEDPEYGRLRHLSHPGKFERTPAAVKRRAPKLGEHNEEILAQLKPLR